MYRSEETRLQEVNENGYMYDEELPTYKAPSNPLNDPYSAKPVGYAKEQAKLGFPKAPPQRAIQTPEDVLFAKQGNYVNDTGLKKALKFFNAYGKSSKTL